MNDARQTALLLTIELQRRADERFEREDAERVIAETRALIEANREPLVEGTTVVEVPLE